ncbi:MAG: CPBP family intramembrane metalloprotease [Salinibacterium sp.]|nr:CPBP family intramembrane glutamic endopeptidase [Salinibacterium sp.]MBF0671726.1 CPBP family intramembrane metalloprotease [Salinibacterium sp.]
MSSRPAISLQRTALAATLPFARVALVAVAALATMGVLAFLGQPAGIAAAGSLSALYLLPVNVITLLVLRRVVHAEGATLRAMLGFDRARLGRDILWGLLWIMVLYVPFAGAIIGTMFALYGADTFVSFEAVFAPDVSELPQLGTVVSIVFAVMVVLSFAPLNAPTEELLFRGYSQPRLRGALGILLPSFAFALQHVFFASTAVGMLVLGVAFFVWGLGSALIFRWQRRLMPLVVAHLVVNLFTSAPALILPFVLS